MFNSFDSKKPIISSRICSYSGTYTPQASTLVHTEISRFRKYDYNQGGNKSGASTRQWAADTLSRTIDFLQLHECQIILLGSIRALIYRHISTKATEAFVSLSSRTCATMNSHSGMIIQALSLGSGEKMAFLTAEGLPKIQAPLQYFWVTPPSPQRLCVVLLSSYGWNFDCLAHHTALTCANHRLHQRRYPTSHRAVTSVLVHCHRTHTRHRRRGYLWGRLYWRCYSGTRGRCL